MELKIISNLRIKKFNEASSIAIDFNPPRIIEKKRYRASKTTTSSYNL